MWTCYDELSKDGELYRFCDNCKSKWITFARSKGIEFDLVPHYRDGCSCHYLSEKSKVKKLWNIFILRKLWKKEIITPEKVEFT